MVQVPATGAQVTAFCGVLSATEWNNLLRKVSKKYLQNLRRLGLFFLGSHHRRLSSCMVIAPGEHLQHKPVAVRSLQAGAECR